MEDNASKDMEPKTAEIDPHNSEEARCANCQGLLKLATNCLLQHYWIHADTRKTECE